MSATGAGSLGSYRIVERIGKGGMGEVYRAQHLRLGREAAVKILPVNLAGDAELRLSSPQWSDGRRVAAHTVHQELVERVGESVGVLARP